MPDTRARQVIQRAKRIVVKVGTSAICASGGGVDDLAVRRLAGQIGDVAERGIRVTLVVSGAIGTGVGELSLPGRPKNMPKLQAAAAVGQGQLMRVFHDVFARFNLKVAQVLLTRDDFDDRTRYLNIRNTLAALDEWDVVGVVNENDTIAVDEIRFGENDILAAMVANMLGADLLVFLTAVKGVIKDGRVLDVIRRVDAGVMSLVTDDRTSLGVGGMSTKLEAAGMVTKAGEVAVIAGYDEPNVLTRLLDGERIGTIFLPARRKMTQRQRWIGQATRPAGKIAIDDGAVAALTKRGKSLLPSGVAGVSGKFGKGAVVAVVDSAGRQIARGLTNYSAEQVGKIKGLKTGQIAKVLGDKPYDEVIHRNNMLVE